MTENKQLLQGASNEGQAALITQVKMHQIQEECIKARKKLFWRDGVGFNYNGMYTPSYQLLVNEEERVNSLTDSFATFSFVSHHCLYFKLQGSEKLHILNTPKHMQILRTDELVDETRNTPYKRIAVELEKALGDFEKAKDYYEQIKDTTLPVVYASTEGELLGMSMQEIKNAAQELRNYLVSYQENLYYTATRQLVNDWLKNAFGGEGFYVTVEVDECSRLYVKIHTRFDCMWQELDDDNRADIERARLPIKMKDTKAESDRGGFEALFINVWSTFKKECEGTSATRKQKNNQRAMEKCVKNNIKTNIINNKQRMKKGVIPQASSAIAELPTREILTDNINVVQVSNFLAKIAADQLLQDSILRFTKQTPAEILERETNGVLSCSIGESRISLTMTRSGDTINFSTENLTEIQIASRLVMHINHLLTVETTATSDIAQYRVQSCESPTSVPLSQVSPSKVMESPMSCTVAGAIVSPSSFPTEEARRNFNCEFYSRRKELSKHYKAGSNIGARRQRLYGFTRKLAKKHGYKGVESQDAIKSLLDKANQKTYNNFYKNAA